MTCSRCGRRSCSRRSVFVCGTLFGHRVLVRIPEEKFRPTVAALLAILGTAMLIRSWLSCVRPFPS
jgi:hypothetical protein